MTPSAATLKGLLTHCNTVKAAAIDAGGNSRHCLTISRYLGKAILQLEALYQAEGVLGPSDDILGNIVFQIHILCC
jgi:hypothetical protein